MHRLIHLNIAAVAVLLGCSNPTADAANREEALLGALDPSLHAFVVDGALNLPVTSTYDVINTEEAGVLVRRILNFDLETGFYGSEDAHICGPQLFAESRLTALPDEETYGLHFSGLRHIGPRFYQPVCVRGNFTHLIMVSALRGRQEEPGNGAFTLSQDFGDLEAAYMLPGDVAILAFERFGARIANITLHTNRPDRGGAELRYVIEFDREVEFENASFRSLGYGSQFQAGGPSTIDHKFLRLETESIETILLSDDYQPVPVTVEVIR